MIDTLIISDIHIPSLVSQAPQAMRIIKRTKFNRLILLGDVFSYFHPMLITGKQLEFLLFIKSLLKKRPDAEVVWVVGNHDKKILHYQDELDVRVVEDYTWTYQGKKYLAIHGHQLIPFLIFRLFIHLVCHIYELISYLDRKGKVSKLAKAIYFKCINPSRKIAAMAVSRYKDQGVNCIICGHTHQAMKENINGVECLNTGSFDEVPSTYVTIGERGAQIHEIG